jgi:hypothetical protein
MKIKSEAIISDCGRYRYRLSRCWDESLPSCLFIMLNPSTADDKTDDRTIKRCIGFAKSWGYGKLYVGNLFAFRTSKPAQMKRAADPVGPDNQHHLERMARKAIRSGGVCIAAWGEDGRHKQQDQTVIAWFDEFGIQLHYLKLTRNSKIPRHPLYLPGNRKPIVWKMPSRPSVR